MLKSCACSHYPPVMLSFLLITRAHGNDQMYRSFWWLGCTPIHYLRKEEQAPVDWICLNTFSQQVESSHLRCQSVSVSCKFSVPLSLKCPCFLWGFTHSRLLSVRGETSSCPCLWYLQPGILFIEPSSSSQMPTCADDPCCR